MPVPRPKLNDAGAAPQQAQYDVSERQIDGCSLAKAKIQIAVRKRQFGRGAAASVGDGEVVTIEEE